MNADDADNPGTGVAAVILAAGLGTRMRSKTPKELHLIAGRPLLAYVLDACLGIQPDQVIVVLSPAKAAVVDTLPAGCEVAWQREPLGTGHAAAQALPLLRPEIEHVAVLFGDHPLLTTEAVERLVTTARREGALVTLLTAELDDPAAYGRLRYRDGRIAGIVEAREDTATYSGKVEINSGISCYRRDWLEAALPHVPRSASGEYYLTALAETAAAETTMPRPVVSVVAEPDVAYGVNDRVELARAEAIVRRRISERLMRAGVTIVDPATTFIDATVEIGEDARIEPFTTITGRTDIGPDTRIGPHAMIRDSRIGSGCVVVASMLEEATVGDRVTIGPFSHLRPGARIEADVHIGNYAEVKNAVVGRGTQIGHFSYVGDAELGAGVNIGAGTITANFDGTAKHRTVIGDDAFIGSDTILRAPVTVGPGGKTGAGSVVTRDVAPGTTVVGVPARPVPPKQVTEPETDDER